MNNLKTVSKAKLKAHMLEYFREVERSGVDLIVTDHRRPVLKIVSLENKANSAQSVFGAYRNKVTYHETLTTPTTDEWSEV